MINSTNHPVELIGVDKRYHDSGGERVVLRGVDLCVAAGEFVVLLGRSGSGKSTLLHLIGGLDTPDRGQVQLAGRDIAALQEPERSLLRRRNIGFIFQAYNLVPTLTVGENLALPLSLLGISGDAAERLIAEQLSAVGLAERARSFPEELSGGEQQRVAIARALVHDPPLILADEPTGNLDLDTAEQVLTLLDERCREQGKTLIMATHSREVVGRADRLLTIRDGVLDEAAP